MLLFLFILYFGTIAFIVFCKKVQIVMAGGVPATFGERFCVAIIWPFLSLALVVGLIRGTWRIKKRSKL